MRSETIPGTVEERRCADPACKAVLVRKRWASGHQESPAKFRGRRYCNPMCAHMVRRTASNERRRRQRLEARLQLEWERQEGQSIRQMPRAEQAQHVELYLETAGLREALPTSQYDSVRLLAALCWRHKGLAAAYDFVQGVARTVRASAAEGRGT